MHAEMFKTQGVGGQKGRFGYTKDIMISESHTLEAFSNLFGNIKNTCGFKLREVLKSLKNTPILYLISISLL